MIAHFAMMRTSDETDIVLQWTQKAGLSFDASGLLGNHRSQRYAAIVQDGEVKEIFVEDEAPSVTVTAADKVLQHL
jgi:peroxiredoxin